MDWGNRFPQIKWVILIGFYSVCTQGPLAYLCISIIQAMVLLAQCGIFCPLVSSFIKLLITGCRTGEHSSKLTVCIYEDLYDLRAGLNLHSAFSRILIILCEGILLRAASFQKSINILYKENKREILFMKW